MLLSTLKAAYLQGHYPQQMLMKKTYIRHDVESTGAESGLVKMS